MNKKILKLLIVSLLSITIGFFIGKTMSSNNTAPTESPKHTHEEETIWTCSMHPQIRQKESGDCPICGMDLTPLDESTQSNPIQLTMTKEAVKLAQVETITVGVGNINKKGKEIMLTGKVSMNEGNREILSAHISGRIEHLYIDFVGEQVQQGQKIAKIYSPELVSAQKELLESLKLKEDMPALYQAAREKLKQWKLPETTINEIEESGLIQNEVTIYSDKTGTIMNKYIENGDYINKGQSLFEVMDLSSVWVLFDIYEKDMEWVRVGQLIEFNFASMPEKTFKSRINFIDPIINPMTRVASARVEIYNPSNRIKPDMFAKGILYANPNKPKSNIELTVPKSAVLWTGKKSVVYTQLKDMEVPTFEFREVILGDDLGQSYIIESGLNEGDEVVVNGAFRLDAAAQLNNNMSMMNRLINIENQQETIPDFSENIPKTFKQQLTTVLDSYLKLKNQLVASDFLESAKTIEMFKEQLSRVDMDLLSDEAHIYWMDLEKDLNAHGTLFSEATKLEEQRQQFALISELLIKAVKAFGLSEDRLYLQHCPMALNDNGANWLSKDKQIFNPYFGDEMLSCGLTKEEL